MTYGGHFGTVKLFFMILEWGIQDTACSFLKNRLGGEGPGRNAESGESLNVLEMYRSTSLKRLREKRQ